MSSKVQLSENEMLNKKVVSSRRKVRNDEAVRRDTGRVFHARAAATGNTRSPRLDRLVAGANKVDVESDIRYKLSIGKNIHSFFYFCDCSWMWIILHCKLTNILNLLNAFVRFWLTLLVCLLVWSFLCSKLVNAVFVYRHLSSWTLANVVLFHLVTSESSTMHILTRKLNQVCSGFYDNIN